MSEALPQIPGKFKTILADPPWRFSNRTGKVAPEHKRLGRYATMSLEEIMALPVAECANENSHLYLWVPNALLPEGLEVMKSWGFRYVSNIIWAKRRKDGGPDGRGVGFYFRNVTEILLFGVRGHMRTLPPGRSQVNMIETRKREHSRKPDEQYDLIESCSPGPYLEMFARYPRPNWIVWGAEASEDVVPKGKRYPGYSGGEIESQSQEIMLPLYPHQRLCDDTNEALAALVAKRYSEGGSIREIAMETGFSIARVRSLLTLAKVEFRARGRSRS
ncbi:MT-A70 family methyltransferase [Parasutterella muris]|jgi:Transcriptional activator, adenine-specific DNA methyltransferase|uniref:DNA methyltransferase n=4 Tax=Parasutterella TaxID=577310 RepID=A0A6L6YM24_9BURK|nr:MT-A70 family methyltransferase [Parasutterella muris]MVX57838.1 DNA methyltransferase [Parasutterella muris]